MNLSEFKPSHSDIHKACMSYRHDSGLLTSEEQTRMRDEALFWFRAWAQTLPQFSDGVATIKVGDVVVPLGDKVLASGCDKYNCAIVVNLKPFVLVSVDADIVWTDTVNPTEVLALC